MGVKVGGCVEAGSARRARAANPPALSPPRPTISFIVMSSSLVPDPTSTSTDGRMQTGGTGRWVRMRSSGAHASASSSASQGMPEATPITRLYSARPVVPWSMPALRYMPTERTMPTSKHSNSGCVPQAAITDRNCCTLATGLSNTMGGQAHWPSSRSLR